MNALSSMSAGLARSRCLPRCICGGGGVGWVATGCTMKAGKRHRMPATSFQLLCKSNPNKWSDASSDLLSQRALADRCTSKGNRLHVRPDAGWGFVQHRGGCAREVRVGVMVQGVDAKLDQP